jgi:regulator of replication initiation timing
VSCARQDRTCFLELSSLITGQMPSCSVDFRPVCGSFFFIFQMFMEKRRLFAKKMSVRLIFAKNKGVGLLVGSVLAYLAWINLVLICSNDVELNPGPQDSVQGATRPLTRQSVLSLSSGNEPSLMDVMAKLNVMDSCMNSKLDVLSREMQTISETVNTLQTELKDTKEQVSVLLEENLVLRETVNSLTDRMCMLEKQSDNLENRSRRNNLLFYGLEKQEGETNVDCEETIRELCTDKLELVDDIVFERVHRVGSSPKAPIIAKLAF